MRTFAATTQARSPSSVLTNPFDPEKKEKTSCLVTHQSLTQVDSSSLSGNVDLDNIRIHFEMLKQTNEPKPSLREKLIVRLESSLQKVHTPSPSAMPNPIVTPTMNPSMDYASWHIFDQASLQQVEYPLWPRTEQMQPMP